MSIPSSTSPRPSSHSSSNSEHELPTMRELNNLVRHRDFQPIISDVFHSRSLTSSQFLHFISLSRTILRLKSDLRDYFIDQESLFIEMQDDVRFRQQIRPIHNYYRQANAHRCSHPYRQPHDTNSSMLSSNSARSMREVMILDMEAPVPASPNSSSSSQPH